MKTKIIFSILILALVGCTKQSGNVTVPIDPTKQYTIKYDLNDQIVKTSVTKDTLNLSFFQKINFLVDPNEFSRSWALHVKQDFSKSYLSNLHYFAFAQSNVYAYDWIAESFNDMHPTQKSVSDTVVNGTKYKKVTLQRTFLFFNVLPNAEAAIDAQNVLSQTKNDSVTFSSFYYFNDVFSLPNVKTVKLTYERQ